MTRRVLVLGDGTRAFLAVVRSLGRRGLTVDEGMIRRDGPETASRYIRRVFALPAPVGRGEALAEAVAALVRTHEYDLVIPTTDPTLWPLHFARAPRVAIPKEPAFSACFDKIETHRVVSALGIPTPPTMAGEPSAAELVALGLPLVLKPRSSYSERDLDQKAHVQVVTRAEDVPRAIAAMCGPFVAQRFFGGVGEGVAFLAHEGAVLLAFQHRRLHEPPNGGGGSYRVSVPLDPEALDWCRAFTRAVSYTGVGMMELKVNGAERRFIEVNGRFWGSLPLAIRAGADFPAALHECLVEGRRSFEQTYEYGVRARSLRSDLKWTARRVLRAQAGTVPLRPLDEVVADTLAFRRDELDVSAPDDPAPLRAELLALGNVAERKLEARVLRLGGRLFASRAQQTLARELRSAAAIEMVCKGNICRSPFAAAYAAKRLGRPIRSSGWARLGDGRVSPPAAIEAAARFGVDLSAHRSRETEASAGLFITFDAEGLAELRARGLHARQLIPGDDVPDPFGGPPEHMVDSYAKIAAAIDALLGGPAR